MTDEYEYDFTDEPLNSFIVALNKLFELNFTYTHERYEPQFRAEFKLDVPQLTPFINLYTDNNHMNLVYDGLLELMSENPDVGIIGPKLLFPDGSFQISFSPEIGIKGEFAARKLHKDAENKSNLHIIEKDFQDIKEVDIVVGAAFFIRTDLFNLLGGFDEKFFMYFEESDLCQRVRNKGYKILYTPYISLIHIRGHSVNKISNKMAVEYRRSQIYYYHKHRPMWEILMLKIYLLFKFLFEYLKTSNPYSWKIIKLIFID
jgi:GT2 family glycosyltransferase